MPINKENKHNLLIGDILYIQPINNAIRHGIKPFEVIIKSFGKKFVNLEKQNGDKFDHKVDKNTLEIISNYSPDYAIFATEKERNDYIERPKNLYFIERNISHLSNDELVIIVNMIKSKI